jgi:hypothetical protein
MLAPGTILQARYKIVRLLARGGMGAVYEARDQRLSSTVALKETFFAEEEMSRAFKREASLLAGLRHSALPKVIDHFIDADGQFLVMEFIPGDDLGAQLLRESFPFAVSDVLNWGDQLLAALEYLHSHEPPIIHRDIKPQNLKLTDRGDVILLDFGLAKGAGTTTPIAMSVRGYTLSYAPLEQIRGLGTNPRSDLYSLAATLYHLMTAVTPPDALSRVAAMVSNQPDPLIPADQLNPPLPTVIAKVLQDAMSQDPEGRPANAARMRAALREAAAAVEAASSAPTEVAGSNQINAGGKVAESFLPATQRNKASIETGEATARATSPDTARGAVREAVTTPAAVSHRAALLTKPRTLILGGAALAAVAVVILIAYFGLSGSSTVAAMDASAASSDRTRPTPLSAKTILGSVGTEDRYFSFVAKRGPLALTLTALAGGSNVSVELLDAQSNTLRFDGDSADFSVNSNAHVEEAKATVLIQREQPLLLHIKASYPQELRVYRLKLDGEINLEGGAASSKATEALAAYLADHDNPQPLKANELISGGTPKDLYYRFNAGPGELKITLNVVSDGGAVSAELFDADSKEIRFEGGGNFAVTSNSHNEQEAASVLLDRKQSVLMRLTNTLPNETRAFRLRFDGPLETEAEKTEPDAVSMALSKYFADRDNPTPLTTNEVAGRGSARDLYYSFTAGPGEVTMWLEVTADGAIVTIEMFDADANKLLFEENKTSFAVANKYHTRLNLDQKQQVLMRISHQNPNALKSYRLKLDGAVSLEGASAIDDSNAPSAASDKTPAETQSEPNKQRSRAPNKY